MAEETQTTQRPGKGRVAKKDLVRVGNKRLTPKQAMFVRAIAEGKPGAIAAMEAYDTDDYNTAGSMAVENLQKPNIREAVDKALEKLNITPEKAVEPIAKALTYEGETERDTLDMRLKGSDRALKLMGAHDNDAPKGGVVNFNFGNTFVKNDIKAA